MNTPDEDYCDICDNYACETIRRNRGSAGFTQLTYSGAVVDNRVYVSSGSVLNIPSFESMHEYIMSIEE